jgi:IclR family transcriptional regulator, KDG regulon repressor
MAVAKRMGGDGVGARQNAKPAAKPLPKKPLPEKPSPKNPSPAKPAARLVAKSDVTRPAADRAAERQGGKIQSLARAFAIIEEIARHREGIGLADLSKRVGLHNSTAFHLAKTLVSLGYVRQDGETKRYRVGRPLFALAASCLDEIEMVHVATPILEDLSRQTGESAHFAVRMSDAVVVIARTAGAGAFQLTERVGVVRPAHCTALGKMILASLSRDELERFLARAELKPSTEKSITGISALRREIDDVRASGIAFDDGEFNAEVRCVAVAVKDFTGASIGAVGISGPIWRMTPPAMQARAKVLQSAAEQLSHALGASKV